MVSTHRDSLKKKGGIPANTAARDSALVNAGDAPLKGPYRRRALLQDIARICTQRLLPVNGTKPADPRRA
jgi:hypothetical protein